MDEFQSTVLERLREIEIRADQYIDWKTVAGGLVAAATVLVAYGEFQMRRFNNALDSQIKSSEERVVSAVEDHLGTRRNEILDRVSFELERLGNSDEKGGFIVIGGDGLADPSKLGPSTVRTIEGLPDNAWEGLFYRDKLGKFIAVPESTMSPDDGANGKSE